jgi:hypothetical protein
MSRAYSEIVRSLENLPEPATFKIAFFDYCSRSTQSFSNLECASA